MKKIVIGLVLAGAMRAAAADFFYRADLATGWTNYADSAIWAVGSTSGENPNGWVPGGDASRVDNIRTRKETATMKLDLGGQTYTVRNLNSTGNNYADENGKYSDYAVHLHLTNGTFAVTNISYSYLHYTLYDGATVKLNLKKGSYRSWACWNGVCYTLNAGSRMEDTGWFYAQAFTITINDGATYSFDPVVCAPHAKGNSKSKWKNYGKTEFPNGLQWTTYTLNGDKIPVQTAGWHFEQYAGEFKLGGPITRNSLVDYPMTFTVFGGVVEATNTVACLDVSGCQFADTACATVRVDAASSFSLQNFTYGTGVKVWKQGVGDLRIADATPPCLTVETGSVTFVTARTAFPAGVTLAPGTTIRFAAREGTRFDTLFEGWEKMRFAVEGKSLISGAVFFRSSDAAIRARVKSDVAASETTYDVLEEGEELYLVKKADYVFDATTGSDLNVAAGWTGGSVPPSGASVYVRGAGHVNWGASSPAYAKISLEVGATLDVSGGTEAAPLDMPSVAISGNATLCFTEGTHAYFTNGFETAGTSSKYPTLEIGTNAWVYAKNPIGTAPDYYGSDVSFRGFTFKTGLFKWYGTLKTEPVLDGQQNTPPFSGLRLGYAEIYETTYFGLDCRGGTYDAGDATQAGGSWPALVRICCPDAGGTIYPIGTLLLQDYARTPESGTAGRNGYWIGYRNPSDVTINVVASGTTCLTPRGLSRYAGGTVMTFKDGAKLKRAEGGNDKDIECGVVVTDNARLIFESGSEIYQPPCWSSYPDTSGWGMNFIPTAADKEVLTMTGGALTVWTWRGNGNGYAHLEDSTVYVGQLYPTLSGKTNALAAHTPVFAGLSKVEVPTGKTLTFSANMAYPPGNWWAKTETWAGGPWDREATLGAPMTGGGNLQVANALTGNNATNSMTLFVTNDNNTATGTAQALTTGEGAAYLAFADGANWAGTVVANAGLKLVRKDGAPAHVTFGTLQMDGDLEVNVAKVEGALNCDQVTVLSNVTGTGRIKPVCAAGYEPQPGECVALGSFPAGVALPQARGKNWRILSAPDPDDATRVNVTLGYIPRATTVILR